MNTQKSPIQKDGVAVITGAAMGIGHAIAERLAQEEMKLVLFDRDHQQLDVVISQLKEKHGSIEIHAVVGDVNSNWSLQTLFEKSITVGEVALLVNNAAVLCDAGPWESVQEWRVMMETNFWSILNIQQKFVPALLEQRGPSAIVNVGSKEGITSPPGTAAYSVSKAALRMLTEQLAHELRQRVGSHVSGHLLIPGYTFTPMNFPAMRNGSSKPSAPWSAAQVAERLIQGLTEGDFYIFCEDNEVTWSMDQRRLQWSADDLILNRPALSRWHPDYQCKFNSFMQADSGQPPRSNDSGEAIST